MKGSIYIRLKERHEEKKKEETRQVRITDHQSRIQQQAERILQRHVDQGELVVCSQQERNATRAVLTGQIQHTRILTVKECVQHSNRKVLQRKPSDAKAINTP